MGESDAGMDIKKLIIKEVTVNYIIFISFQRVGVNGVTDMCPLEAERLFRFSKR
jgi:hypothetical protein